MDTHITLRRSSKCEDLSRGRQVKREGQGLGLPTSESKRTKRNPMTSFQNILSQRPTITLKRSVLQSARDKSKQVGEGRDKLVPQGKTGLPKKKTADQENIDPVSRIPLPQKKSIFGNPFTKKKQTAHVSPPAPPAPLAPKQHLIKVRVPAPNRDTKTEAPMTKGTIVSYSDTSIYGHHSTFSVNNLFVSSGVRATSATSATSRPVSQTEGIKRDPSSTQRVSQGQLAPQLQRKPLGTGTISQSSNESSSSSLPSQPAAIRGVTSRLIHPGTLNQSLNSSFLQTFSNMNTLDPLVVVVVVVVS